jgi:hypothetical protein
MNHNTFRRLAVSASLLWPLSHLVQISHERFSEGPGLPFAPTDSGAIQR